MPTKNTDAGVTVDGPFKTRDMGLHHQSGPRSAPISDQEHQNQVQDLFDMQIKSGLSPTTVAQTYRVFNQAMKDAVRWHYIPRNPLEMIRSPKPQRTEMAALNTDQLTVLLDATKGTEFGTLIFLA
jgi:site-specific recombinase XerC